MTGTTRDTAQAAWAPTSGTSGFTPPSFTPARVPSSELRPAESPQKTKRSKKPARSPRKKPSRLGTVLLSMTVVVLVVIAGLMIWKAFTPESVDAPLPAAQFADRAGEVTGPVGDEAVDVGDGKTMTAAEMSPDSLFIPALGVYMPIQADATFVKSSYSGFETLKIPKNPKYGVWYAGGASMYGGEKGATLIAAHASSRTGWGALRPLYKLTGGEMIYTKDAAGQLQSWQMSTMRVENHKNFPQEYWSAEGDRRLVLTTCGGKVKNGVFKQNVFAIAVPVNPKPKTPEQLQAEGVIANVGTLSVQKHAEALAEAGEPVVDEPVQPETQPAPKVPAPPAPPVKQPEAPAPPQPVQPLPVQPPGDTGPPLVEQTVQPVA